MSSSPASAGSAASDRAGRYAPSPTGPLHFGSLLAAVGSFAHARSQGAAWYLRIDDLEPARTVPGMDQKILATLAAHGLRWDGPVLYQSQRHAAYADALNRIRVSGDVFDCGCTRREARQGPKGIEGPIYPGTCRPGLSAHRAPRSVRLKTPDLEIGCIDAVQGECRQRLARDVGDFVVRRADGVTAYQLATVVDDAAQGVEEVVRGADLLSSTPRQIYLMGVLGLPQPTYAHLPVLVDARGAKLSKSAGALALRTDVAGRQIWTCLELLGQGPPVAMRTASPARLLTWATDNWSIGHVPKVATLPFMPDGSS